MFKEIGTAMNDKNDYENEYDEFCQAFNELYNTIKDLRQLENNAKELNYLTLKKSKNEIESLLEGINIPDKANEPKTHSPFKE